MTLYIMVGIAGSGKSYFAKHRLCEGKMHTIYISRDEIRYSMMNDGDKYFDKEDAVFNEFVRRIKLHLSIGADAVIADATHLHWGSRRKLLNALGLLHNNVYRNLSIIPVVMNTDIVTAIQRNNSREGQAKVPENIIMNMYNSMTSPWNDPFNYTAVMEVRA